MKSQEQKELELEHHLLSAYEPDPIYTVSEWADAHRYLSQRASAEPGQWRTSRTPYLKEIMDCLSSFHPAQQIVFMKSAQIGGTECGNNWIGYIIDHVPAPTLLVQPTVEMAKRNSKQRIDPLIEESPTLRKKVRIDVRKTSDNSILHKQFPGGVIVMTGANSAAGLRSLPARNVFLDEVDAYPGDVGGEGDPVELAKARARTFAKRKIFLCSTPTIDGSSRIQDYYTFSDKRLFFIPCPFCGHMQDLVFSQLKWPEGKPLEAQYECIECGKGVENWRKTSMLAKGEWRATDPLGQYPGFHISALYSPVGWFSWGEVAQLWENSKANPEATRSFNNTVLGITHKEVTDTPDWNRLYERRENYRRNTVPVGVCFLTCGVDVQRDRIELEIVGWSREKVSYSIDYRTLTGDTSDEAVWLKLDQILTESFPLANNPNLRMGIRMLAIDTGFNTQQVYNWARKYPTTKVMAVKGSDHLNVIIGQPKAIDVTISGKTIRRGIRVWPVGVSVIKTELYGWLRLNKAVDGEADPHGYCHFPEYDPEYFKMLTAEHQVTKLTKGFRRSEWVKIRDRNESLDCRVYARAAAYVEGIDRFTEENWRSLENDRSSFVVAQQPQPKKRKKRESDWL